MMDLDIGLIEAMELRTEANILMDAYITLYYIKFHIILRMF